MRVLSGMGLVAVVVLCSAALSAGSVTGYYYAASVEAGANVEGNGTGGEYAYNEHYSDYHTDSLSGATAVSAHVEAAAGPDGYVWPEQGWVDYPRSGSDAAADFLALDIDCYGDHGAIGMDLRCNVSAYARSAAEARFEINETASWTLALSGAGQGPWLSGEIEAQLFGADMSLVQQWNSVRTGSMGDHWFTLSTTDTFGAGTYHLYLTGWGSAYSSNSEADSASIWMKAQVLCPVPAPGALLLAGLGWGCVRWLRRRI